MIVSGLERATDASVIIDKIDFVLDVSTRRYKGSGVITFIGPASVGVIAFETVAAKTGFYRKLKGLDITLESGRHLTFKDNEPWELRMRNKSLGQVKYQVNKQLNIALDDIKINRAAQAVEVNKKTVAWFKEGTQFELAYDDSVNIIAEEVDKVMKVKLNKKNE